MKLVSHFFFFNVKELNGVFSEKASVAVSGVGNSETAPELM